MSFGSRALGAILTRFNRGIIHSQTLASSSVLRSHHSLTCAERKRPQASTINNMMIVRGIFDQTVFHMNKLETLRNSVDKRFSSDKDAYINRIRNYLESGQYSSILSDDLVSLLGLAEKEEHLDLVENVIMKLKDSEYINTGWGSVLMRVYYSMGLSDRAYNAIKDTERFGKFFNQLSSFRMAMVMLYDAKEYDKVIDLFNVASERNIQSKSADFDPMDNLRVILFAALARINTPESFEIAKSTKIPEHEGVKAHCYKYLSLLALRQNDPKLAIDLIVQTGPKFTLGKWSIKVLSLIKMKRYDDVLVMIHDMRDNQKDRQTQMIKEVHETLLSVEGEMDENIRNDLVSFLESVRASDLIVDFGLEDVILRSIRVSKLNFYPQSIRSQPRREFQRERGRGREGEREHEPETEFRQPHRYQRRQTDRSYYDRPRTNRRPRYERNDEFEDLDDGLREGYDNRRDRQRFNDFKSR